MSPVVERIAEGIRNRAGPRHELVDVRGVSGDETLWNAIGPHGAPLIVIAFEPDFVEVVEAPFFGYVLGWEMTVIVDDRLGFGILVIELLRFLGMEKKILT